MPSHTNKSEVFSLESETWKNWASVMTQEIEHVRLTIGYCRLKQIDTLLIVL